MSETFIHLARDGQELGCFSLDQLPGWLADGTLNGQEFGWREGWKQWRHISDLVEVDLATPRQLAFLNYLRVPMPKALMKQQASDLIEATLQKNSEAGISNNWATDRFRLHPDLYAHELLDWKESRAEELHEALIDGELSFMFTRLSKRDIQSVIDYLDGRFPGWDAFWRSANGYEVNPALLIECFLPAISLRTPEKIKARFRGNVTEDKIAPPNRSADEDEFMEDIIELQLLDE